MTAGVSDPPRNQVPYGAKGFDLGGAVVALGRDKLVVASKTAGHHLTVHFGSHSQVLDIHETCTGEDGSVTHTKLFEISHASLAAMLQEIALPAMRAFAGLLRPLRPGWMAKRRVGAVVGLLPAESEIPLVTRLRHRKLVVDPEKLAAQAWAPEFLDDLYELRDGQAFTLFSCKDPRRPRMIGIGFKFSDPTGRRRLVWISSRRVPEAFKGIHTLLADAAARHGIFHKPLPWL